MDDKELDFCIKSFKNTGDNAYYEKIYRFFFKKIYRFVFLNISDKLMAEDITIDVFFKVYTYISRANLNSTSFKPWIYKIARNLIIDYYRKEEKFKKNLSLEQYMEEKQIKNFEDAEKIDDFLAIDDFTSSEFTESDSLKFDNPDLLIALSNLSDIQRQVIILRFVEELDYKSIGLIINKNEFTVRTIKFRAILKLKEQLAKH
ncbi:MAG: RNA polymerase sigma factor [Actinomycetota bacterium]|nr:RNA polymerase sigma factor [Actinomycetota bacterium]